MVHVHNSGVNGVNGGRGSASSWCMCTTVGLMELMGGGAQPAHGACAQKAHDQSTPLPVCGFWKQKLEGSSLLSVLPTPNSLPNIDHKLTPRNYHKGLV